MKILNLYCGIGGNRKLWGEEHEVTAVELDANIAEVYKKLYPNDTVIVGDAHEYLRKNFRYFDFIWASPPCPTHSRLQLCNQHKECLNFPDMTLYQEIIWLQTFFKGKWLIENVKPYYKPLINPTFCIDRHYFWSSDFILTNQILCDYESIRYNIKEMAKTYGFDMADLKGVEVRKVLRNCVVPEIGLHIFEQITKNGNNNAKG